MSVDINFLGKKIVFVNPPDLVKGPIMELLTFEELEVYALMNHEKISEIVAKYTDTIFFINVDVVQSENEWQDFIEKMNSAHPGFQFGIMSFKICDQKHVQYYLLDLGASCGFIQLKQGTKVASDMMMKILKANEVKGRRKFLRYQCNEEDRTTVNFSVMDLNIDGKILDISSVGMSCNLSAHQGLVKNQLIRNMQMRLRGSIVNTEAILMGTRIVSGEASVYVFLFKADPLDKMKEKVRYFIFNSFQRKFNREFSLQQ